MFFEIFSQVSWNILWHLGMSPWSLALFIEVHSGPENLKKSRQKNSWNQINQKIFSWNCIFGSIKFFPTSKIDFLVIFKIEKNGFWAKTFFSWKWFISDSTSFFGLHSIKYSGPLCTIITNNFYYKNMCIFFV